ncbi:unnamed protein product [Protopolystoma xenopodis]|uniref:Ras-associating domain-containing protein n=1 Tax=Protopolystoma xenopodis TaxID=117903 RepID=A0A3S5BCP6_9PLAT|nr:unnamed protein product [Protopolystoma xenopodis]
MIVRVHQANKTTKALQIDSETTAFDMITVLLEKNFMAHTTSKLALVEKVPSMKLGMIFSFSTRHNFHNLFRLAMLSPILKADNSFDLQFFSSA